MKSKYYTSIGEFLIPTSLLLLLIFIFAPNHPFTTMLHGTESAFWTRYLLYFLIFILFPLVTGVFYFLIGWKEKNEDKMLAQSAVIFSVMMVF